jgi:hypothetical protein
LIQSGLVVVHFDRKSSGQVKWIGLHWLKNPGSNLPRLHLRPIGEVPEREVMFLAMKGYGRVSGK